MELKVWVEGIQRIICGVTEATTCQDVVYALAHATGKTGRFTLIERWRSNERLLPPQEHPLQVLSKWGEYANDVQLVLRHARESSSSAASSSSFLGTPDSVQGGGVASPQPLHNEAAASAAAQVKATSPQPSSAAAIIRREVATTHTNGGGGSAINANLLCHNHNNNNSKVNESSGDLQTVKDVSKERRDWSEVPRGVVKGIPQQPTREPPRWTEQPPPSNYRPSRSATEKEPNAAAAAAAAVKLFTGQNGRICSSAVASPTQRTADCGPATASRHNGRYDSDNAVPPNVENASQDSSGMHQQCVPSPSYVPPPQPPVNHLTQCNIANAVTPVLGSSSSSNHSHRFGGGGGSNPKNSPGDGGGSASRSPCVAGVTNAVHLGTPKSRRNLLSEFKRHDLEEELLQEDFPLDPIGKKERVIFDARYRDLVRLVNLQREKLSRQQADLTRYDAEIAYWEEKQKDHKRQIENIECEIKKAEFSKCDIDEEVGQLDRLHLDNELEIGRQQEKMLSSELTLLRSKLSNCETELLQCKNKMRLVMDSISEDERWLSKEEDERKQREVTILDEIEAFQNDIQNTIRDYESKSETSDKYDLDVKRLETVITDKKKQVESLVREMKEANLESLTFTPSEEIRQLLEGGAHKGPGSSRKIVGSPRQLENAVPTSKNPHGVWV